MLQPEWEEFLEKTGPRTALQCSELLPYLNQIKGTNYKEVFDNALEIVAKARAAYSCKWIGIKDSWSIEFLYPLARAYPEAKFIIIFRDPRAIINSMLGVINKDPSKVAHALSYVRHWRKHVAFTIRYQNDPMFNDRLYVLTHEEVLNDPTKKALDLCNFLEIPYDSAMTDTNNFVDYATGSVWKGNSSFEETTSGFSMHRAERWKETLDPKALKMIEFTCGIDMQLMGYTATSNLDNQWPDPDVLDYLVQSANGYANWRSDFGDLQKDFGFELFRHALVTQSKGIEDSSLIRRSFLFEEVFTELRKLNTEPTVMV